MKKILVFITAILLVISGVTPVLASPVDLELSLLIDVSGSVDTGEFNLQRGGYVSAFNNVALWNAVDQGAIGKIAVNLVYWSGAGQQIQAVGWTLIDSYAASQAFAASVLASNRTYSGLTAPGSAINFAVPLFNNAFEGTREVIDVSGDGQQNDGADTAAARAAALAAGIDAINGLAIGNAALETWYMNNIVGGTGAFVLRVDDFADFGNAIDDKIAREIVGTPEPLTLLLLGAGLFGLGILRRRD